MFIFEYTDNKRNRKINTIFITLIAILVVACALMTMLFVRQKAKVEVLEKNEQKYINDFKEKEQFLKKEALISAKEQLHQERMELDELIRDKNNEFDKIKLEISKKQDEYDQKCSNILKKETMLDNKYREIEQKEDYLADTIAKQITELERVAQMSREEAKSELLSQLKEELASEQIQLIRENEMKIKEDAEEKAREILSQTMQKCAIEQVIETSVCVVSLPSDEMKGRIIGREGRNIRTLETLTGVDLIIDDTPEAVVLSCFDPIRREVAKLTIEKLIQDGRIHPVRIEEIYEKSLKEVENKIKQEGERAAVDLGIMNLNKELSKTLGRLYYRTSFGQNVLKHSIEVGQIAGMLASELGSDVKLAKRAGLLHDIGKAVDQEQEGTHVQLGADLCRRYGEKEVVVHAIEAHHDDVACNTLTDALVKIADTISAGRPGARRDTLEIYIKRLKKLEEIANSYEGIKQTFAVSAGREVRVIVQPDVFDDIASAKLARDIAKRIEDELEYPGQIRVTVVREARVVEVAK